MGKTGCRLPFMQQKVNPKQNLTQARLCKFRESGRTMADLIQLWNEIKGEKSECPKIQRCQTKRYDLNTDNINVHDDYDTTQLYVRLDDLNVQYVTDSYTYDELSFIAEVGGTLGLLLGLSFLSLIDLFEALADFIAREN